ncbi:MAG: flagellar basal body rod protein FlgB [Myxococcota bacterium]
MASLFSGVGVSQQAMSYHLERHNVLASNVANLETPGFRPVELVRDVGQAERFGSMVLQRTNEAHVRASNGVVAAGEPNTRIERVVQPANDGNAVSLEREMAKVAANDLRYQTVGRLVKAQLGMLRYAASDAQGQ